MEESIDVERLISEVESRTILWENKHKEFKIKKITDKLWKEVGENCKCSGSIAKRKWKNLKDTYRRILHKFIRTNAESNVAKNKIKWPYFERMSFVANVMPMLTATESFSAEPSLTPTEDNYSDVDNFQCDEEDVKIIIDEINTHENCFTMASMPPVITSNPLEYSNDDSSNSSSSCMRGRKRRRSSVERINDKLKKENERHKLLKKSMNNESSDLQFFRSLLPFMEKFSEVEKLEVRGDIQTVILNKLKSLMQAKVV